MEDTYIENIDDLEQNIIDKLTSNTSKKKRGGKNIIENITEEVKKIKSKEGITDDDFDDETEKSYKEKDDDEDDEIDEPDDTAEDIVIDVDETDDLKHIFMNKEYVYKIQIIPPDERRTSDILTLYEFTEIISTRAEQIERGSVVYTDVNGLDDPIKMAEKEFNDRRTPLVLNRNVGIVIDHNKKEIITYVEYFNVREMSRLCH